MSRTRKQYEIERRLRRFIPKSRARVKRFEDENALDEPGRVVFRPHGARRPMVSESASITD